MFCLFKIYFNIHCSIKTDFELIIDFFNVLEFKNLIRVFCLSLKLHKQYMATDRLPIHFQLPLFGSVLSLCKHGQLALAYLHLTLKQTNRKFRWIFINFQGPIFVQPVAQGQQDQETYMKMWTPAPPDKRRHNNSHLVIPRVTVCMNINLDGFSCPYGCWLCCFYSRCLSSLISRVGILSN